MVDKDARNPTTVKLVTEHIPLIICKVPTRKAYHWANSGQSGKSNKWAPAANKISKKAMSPFSVLQPINQSVDGYPHDSHLQPPNKIGRITSPQSFCRQFPSIPQLMQRSKIHVDGGVKERDGGVDEERVSGESEVNDLVCRLEEAEAGNNREKLGPPVEQNLKHHGHDPQQQSRSEESRCFGVSVSSPSPRILHSLALARLSPLFYSSITRKDTLGLGVYGTRFPDSSWAAESTGVG
ncbi:hypothetical protein ACLOJK_001159 [Asimina triloba]